MKYHQKCYSLKWTHLYSNCLKSLFSVFFFCHEGYIHGAQDHYNLFLVFNKSENTKKLPKLFACFTSTEFNTLKDTLKSYH